MTVKIPILKIDFFLISFVLAFLLIVFPVSADYYTPTNYPGGGTFVNASDVISWSGGGASSGDCLQYGADYLPFPDSSYVQLQKYSYTTGQYVVGVGSTSSYTVTATDVTNQYRMAFSGQCRQNGGSYTRGYPVVSPWYVTVLSDAGVVSQFTANPTSGYLPLEVQFTDTSLNSPTSWNWNFGDGTANSTLQNPSHTYSSAGSYTVTLIVSKSGSTDTEIKTGYITVSSYVIPTASFTCSPTNTTSPAVITCTDGSSNSPTSWTWTFDSLGVQITPGTINGGIYTSTNTTQNPNFTASGSGTINVNLIVSNPAGSTFLYRPSYITISGLVPTPTPTPSVPWPNQTGVCTGSSITLGSGATRDHLEHFQLTSPTGDTFSGQYNIGETNYVSGQSFFTARVGQYIYQEYTYDAPHTLEWQQSYITENCLVTTVPTTSLTVIPTPYITTNLWGGNNPVIITYPTVPATLDLSQNWNTSINLVPATIATFSTWNATGNVNYTDIRNTIATNNPLLIPYLNFIDSLMTQPMYWYFQFLSMVITIQALVSPAIYSISLFSSMLNALDQYLILTTVSMNVIVSNIPIEWQNFFSMCLVGDLVIYIWQLKSGRSI